MKKFLKRIHLFWRKKQGKPIQYNFASEKEGVPIGVELEVYHLTFHDMATYACQCRLTEEQLLNGLDANAIKITGFKRIDKYNGITTFQPCKT
ncbi:hypothetical protein J7J13_03565 [bacterium]|nr:hypothetical protein [bacterium]